MIPGVEQLFTLYKWHATGRQAGGVRLICISVVDCPLSVSTKALALYLRHGSLHAQPRSFPSSSSFFFPFLPPTSSWNAAGGEPLAGPAASSGGARGAGWPPHARPQASPSSSAPRPARPNLRRTTGGCGREERESERRCSVSGGWTDAGREGKGGGPPFEPVRRSLSGSCRLASWCRTRHPLTIWSCPGDGLLVLLAFGPVVVLANPRALLPDYREFIEATPHPGSTSPPPPHRGL